ncbi:UDP-N-acetylmuramoyl-tripeptide--D-alanyl-D-alanine ligase [Bifidobacterium jacchi]|uniref:UDP-N-acetylmuramoyl-tripeptide--D-alanyl-D-alanine ligase n=1 Tax=Bifidobacterium jacchi TaxID=2490545 RepID=A0A5N5RFH7_9BIFI|nr:UDP-N-acetylmuramoyl-tripeptide--D-alanyl-D-alanine ligase [Bifidobacterium jacchi]KAB5605985.1 UDP-N-acetylmuramoyl-tripeptide--D-alanyl-D-alanine ligase [Bifidobacterium jacchi]
MMPMSLEEIVEATGGRLALPTGASAPAGDVATSAVSDSRQVRPGAVFVAIAGERVDGHDFVARAADAGAVCALTTHTVDAALPQIVVDDTVAALGELARHNIARRRACPEPFSIIGITGSVGKTTTKDLLAALLTRLGPTVAPIGSFNNEIGLPLTALKVGPSTRFLVAEMGASHIGEIARLTRIAPPDVSVVLKVGVAHLGEFGSVERIAQAKSEIVQGLLPGGLAVLNADDEHVAAMRTLTDGPVRWFALNRHEDREPALIASDIASDRFDHPSFVMSGPLDATTGEPQWRQPVSLAISGRHNAINALAASTVALHFGLTPREVAETLAGTSRISAHRMAVSHVESDGASFTLIDDSFNANPDSMRAGIDGLRAWNAGIGEEGDQSADGDASSQTRPYRIAVLGAMLELGPQEVELHRQTGAYAARQGLDAIIAVGNGHDEHFDALAAALVEGARSAAGDATLIEQAADAAEAQRIVERLAHEHGGAVVLLKGSHASGLSVLAERWSSGCGSGCGSDCGKER